MEAIQHERCSGLWRSENMERLDLILQRDALHDTVLEIGLLGKAQFIDLNEGMTAFSRPFTNEIRRCEDIQRKLRTIEEEFIKEPELLVACTSGPYAYDFDMCATVMEARQHLAQSRMSELDERIEGTLWELLALVASAEGIHSEMNHDQELSMLNYRLRGMVARHPGGTSVEARAETLARLSILLGVVPAERSEAVMRLCYRVSRGNAVVEVNTEAQPLVNPKTGQRNVFKTTFVVLGSSPRMIERLRSLVAALGATLYTVDEVVDKGGLSDRESSDDDEGDDPQVVVHSPTSMTASAEVDTAPGPCTRRRGASASPVSQRPSRGSLSPRGLPAQERSTHADLADALEKVKQRKWDLLSKWYTEHRQYKVYLKVERAVLTTMNLCKLSGATCTASVWVARKHVAALQRAMDDAVATSGSAVQSIVSRHPNQKNPPTYFETNKFTSSFQGIVDSYGMARYKEVNPGVFTIITFPYLFGIMFGDIGHGILLLLISLYLIAKERSWNPHQLPEILAMIFGGRYLILLMSLFAIYMGVLYNDFFGFSLNIFPSGYTWAPMENQTGLIYPTAPNGNHSVKPRRVYAVGLDVAWAETENKLEYYNSVKMKCAVIVGVVQMFTGLLLSLSNYVYYRDWYKVVFMFVPEFVFLLATFGYMSVLIMIKWCTTWENTNDAPSILETMTNFFLQPGTVPQPPLFKGQAKLQFALLIIAFLMVPVLLLGMPAVEWLAYRKWKASRLGGTIVLGADRGGAGDFPPSGAQGSSIPQTTVAGPFNQPAVAAYAAAAGADTHSGDMISSDGSLADLAIFGPPHASAGPGAVGMTGGATANEDAELYMEDDELDERFAQFEFTEMMIHYIIHTIEYVLSSVSNTASYLRLWALSLAHAQLSEVFFTFAVVNLLNADTTGFAIGFGVFAWLGVTLGVLVGMEALSAFLHALRLHWVEFQNKFYLGDGTGLEPFDLLCFNTVA